MYKICAVDFNKYNSSDYNGLITFPKPPTHLVPSTQSLQFCRSNSITSGYSGKIVLLYFYKNNE